MQDLRPIRFHWFHHNPAEPQPIHIRLYETVVILIEVIVLLIRSTYELGKAIYQFFVPPAPKSVKGEIILITGAGHGMGREVAIRLARLGGKVVCLDVNASANQETVNLILDDGGTAYGYLCDVRNRDIVMDVAAQVRKDVGDVTMLINNAGIMPCKPFMQHSEEEMRNVFAINIMAQMWLVQAYLNPMRERNHGHIVAMSSMAGLMGLRNLVPYCATKYAVRGLMESLSEELREDPRDYKGIKFTTVYPYIVDTGLARNPRVKFPWLMKIVSPQEAADKIVDAIRRNYFAITIPSSLYYNEKFYSGLPRALGILAKDFVDSGLEPQ